jgi:TolB-like protein/tetratricopeptide (TPR) repeat protein
LRYSFADCTLDTDGRELRRSGGLIAVTPQVFDLLEYLIRNRERVVSKDDLIAAIWNGRIVSESALTTRINAARSAIGDSGEEQRLIKTLPRKGIRFVGGVSEERVPIPTMLSNLAEPSKHQPAGPDRPSIAVLPFNNMSNDPEQEYFVDGMVEEIITALSHIRWLLVIARNSSFAYKGKSVDVKLIGRELGVRYVLEGSVRKAGERVRITAQLIDTTTGAHLWADCFDGLLQDVFELQERVALSVAGVIEPALKTAELRRSAERQTNDLTAPRSAEPERRQLTIMACRMVAVPLSGNLDPEELRDRIGAFQQWVADVAARFDGIVAQHQGDSVLVYFGYPTAHEHDAEQAVRAGLALVNLVGPPNTGCEAPPQASVGIATGVVVIGEQVGTGVTRQHIAIGEAPNLAAQLQAVAAPGEVVIAASTRRLVGRLFDCCALDGADELDGLPQPVEAWQVRGEMAGVSRFEARRTGTLTPLVGRQEELELLLRRWDQAKRGEGRVVLLSGEPGIGKSRIVESLLTRLEGEPHVRLRYFCSPHHTHSPLYPIIAQLERAASFEPCSSSGAKLDKLEALLKLTATNVSRDVALVAELLGVLADGRYPPLALSPQHKREMTLAALLDQLDGAAAHSPVLIVFEDIHWIDPTSLDLLDRMIARVAELPALLVIAFRPELQPTWIGRSHVTMLTLSRLSRCDSAKIIGGVTRGKALPDAVVEQVLARTDGVPLFIEELTSSLLESGALRETEDRYALNGPLPAVAVPTTLQASLVARLDRLGSAKDVAQIGAAIGREFSYELLGEVVPSASVELDAALQRLTASGLILRRGVPPIATYSFSHALVQDAAYTTLLKSRRRQLHASIAKVLVERFSEMTQGQPELVAQHFAEAGLASEAIEYWVKAGRLGLARWAIGEAVDAFEQALHALKALPESQSALGRASDVLRELGSVLILFGEPRRGLARLREAETLAERLNDDRRRGRVWALMTNAHSVLGELDEALRTGTRALEAAGPLGDLRLRITATSYLEQAHYYRNEFEQVVALATDNLAALPADWRNDTFGRRVVPVSVFDRGLLIMSLAELGRFGEAAELEAEAIRLAEAMQGAFVVGWAHMSAGALHLFRGDWTRAHPIIEHATAVMRAGNVAVMLDTLVACSAWVLAQLGKESEALSLLREGERFVERQAASGFIGLHRSRYRMLGRAAFALGRLEEARRMGQLAFESLPRQPGWAAHALLLLGDVASHPDQFDAKRGEAHYRHALALAGSRGMRPLIAHCHLGLGKLYWRSRRRKQAHEHLTAATAMYREMDMRFWLEQAEAGTGLP